MTSPTRLAEACRRLGLRHVVITSVTRDDLADGGADHFRRCVLAVRERTGATIEVLTPDFDGRADCLDIVLSARPEVFNHNLETVARLQQHVRRKSQYDLSLSVLSHVKTASTNALTKSGLMLGLGETTEEIVETLADLRSIGCDLADASGSIFSPRRGTFRSVRYLPPDEFAELGRIAARWDSSRSPAAHSSAPAIMPTRWRSGAMPHPSRRRPLALLRDEELGTIMKVQRGPLRSPPRPGVAAGDCETPPVPPGSPGMRGGPKLDRRRPPRRYTP